MDELKVETNAQPTPVTGTELPPLSGHARYGRRASKAVSSRKFHFIEPAIKALFEREDQLLSCMAERDAALERIRKLGEALEEISEECYDRVDIDDEGRPNFAMRIQTMADTALRAYAAVKGEGYGNQG